MDKLTLGSALATPRARTGRIRPPSVSFDSEGTQGSRIGGSGTRGQHGGGLRPYTLCPANWSRRSSREGLLSGDDASGIAYPTGRSRSAGEAHGRRRWRSAGANSRRSPSPVRPQSLRLRASARLAERAFGAGAIAHAIRGGSAGLDDRKRGHVEDYVRPTADAAVRARVPGRRHLRILRGSRRSARLAPGNSGIGAVIHYSQRRRLRYDVPVGAGSYLLGSGANNTALGAARAVAKRRAGPKSIYAGLSTVACRPTRSAGSGPLRARGAQEAHDPGGNQSKR
jgi:hypothetical protein